MNTTAQNTRSCPPKLTENERRLLDKHQGCTKCRKGYQNHRAGNCPNDFPDTSGYTELTEQLLLGHKCSTAIPSSSCPVGAVMDVMDVDVENNTAFAIGAVMLSSVLDAGDTMDEEVCAPLTAPHFRWPCHLTGPNTEFPCAVNSMINIGMHGVFINPDVVEECGFHCLKLHKPLLIDLALQNG